MQAHTQLDLSCYPLRWEHEAKARYYEVRVCRDLLGATIVLCHWGGIGSKLGGLQEKVVAEQSVSTVLANISRRRLQRGYAPRQAFPSS